MKKIVWLKNMKHLDLIFIFLGFMLVPYYVFSSGSLQPAHILFLLAYLFHKNKYNIDRVMMLRTSLFFCYCLIVNLIYSIYYVNFSFLIFPINLFYDLIVFFLIVDVLRFNKNLDIKNEFSKVILMIFAIQLLQWMLGFGNYNFFPRYNGFFNDPNQMAFFVLCCLAVALSNDRNKITNLIIVVLGFWLIFITQSRSATIGLVFIFLSLFIYYSSFLRKYLPVVFLGIIILVYMFLNFYWNDVANIILNSDNFSRFKEVDVSTQSEDRGFDRILNYPEYLLFGAGQGYYERFNSNLEIHSTWIGFLFYYGVIGLFLFLNFIYKIFSNLNLYRKFLFLAPLFYSFSTFGARTVVFWIFLAVFYGLTKEDSHSKVLV